jgi:hypothetical protein
MLTTLLSQCVNLNFDELPDFGLDGEGWIRHHHHSEPPVAFYPASGPLAFCALGQHG